MKPRKPMKRTYWKRKPRKAIKPVSDKRAKLNRAVAGLRKRLVNEAGCCMACGFCESNPNPKLPVEMSRCACHEIYRGSAGRPLSLDKTFGLLVLCWACNSGEFDDAEKWPRERQLALLLVRNRDAFNLAEFNRMVCERAPNRITLQEVEAFLPSIPTGWPWE